MSKIFDAQVNHGSNVFGPCSSLETYHQKAPKDYSTVLVIPTATHRLTIHNDIVEESCLWSYEGRLRFYRYLYHRQIQCGKIENPSHPYQNLNRHVLKKVRYYRKQQSRQYYFCPKYHPHLDKQIDVEPLLLQAETKAVKINGIASFSTPDDIPTWFITLLKRYALPLFVHTHYFNPNQLANDINPWLYQIGLANHPIHWIRFGLKHDIKIFLAHGLHLCPVSARLVNDSDQFLVGLGPISLLSNEAQFNHPSNLNYLEQCLQLVSTDKLAYCSDFAWNIHKREQWGNYCWKAPEKIKQTLLKMNESSALSAVLHDNAARFFIGRKEQQTRTYY